MAGVMDDIAQQLEDTVRQLLNKCLLRTGNSAIVDHPQAVVADAHRLPKGKGEDYYPKYPLGRRKKRSCVHGRTSSGACRKRSR